MNLPTIQSLWIGNPLSKLERLCVQSFLDHGHEFHLYTYGEVGNIPAGCTVKDGNKILPAKDIFQYRGGSYAGFSNWFRYEMLMKLGGFWVDMDMVCVRPFDFGDEFVFGKSTYHGANTAVIGGRHAALEALCEYCRQYPKAMPFDSKKNRSRKFRARLFRQGREGAKFGHIGGPSIFTDALKYHGVFDAAKPHTYFYPIGWLNYDSIFDETFANDSPFVKDTHAIHIWNDGRRRDTQIDKNAAFPHDSLIEQLKRRHNIR